MISNPAVIFDACVFYPAPLLHILVELAGEAQELNLFRAKWTNAIHEEWISNLLTEKPHLTRDQLTQTRRLMDSYVDDCLVTDFEHRIDGLTLSDPNDRHVLAAAIHSGANIIVTNDNGFFDDRTILASYGIVPMSPDDFICDLLDTHETLGEEVLERAARSIKGRLRNPAFTWNQYFDVLRRNGLGKVVERLKEIIPEREIKADDRNRSSISDLRQRPAICHDESGSSLGRQ